MIRYFYSIVINAPTKNYKTGTIECKNTISRYDFKKEIASKFNCKINQVQIIAFSRL